MQRNRTWLAALALTALAPITVSAAETGLYFGAGAGHARYELKQSEFDDTFVDALDEAGIDVIDGDSDIDKNVVTGGAFVGYRIIPYLAIEAGYVDLGKAKYDVDADIFIPFFGTETVSGSASLESRGPTVSVLGIWPINEAVDLYARAGVFFSKTKLKVSLEGDSETFSGKDEDVFFGFGAGWNITPNWTLRLEAQGFDNAGKKNDTGQVDVSAVNVSVLFRI